MQRENKKNPQFRTVAVRMTKTQYDTLEKKFKNTTFRILSQFLRAVLIEEPITVWCRDKSLDDFLLTAIALKNELMEIDGIFSEAVERLKTLDNAEVLPEDIEYYQAAQISTEQKISEIKSTLLKIYEQCMLLSNPHGESTIWSDITIKR